MTLPLLHAAQSATGLTRVNSDVLVLALAAFVSGAVVVWRPRLRMLGQRRIRHRVMVLTTYGAMTIAVLPSVLPLDHILSPHVDSGNEQQVHTSHCHGSPSSCSDVPLLSGPGQLLASEPLILVPALVLGVILATTLSLKGRTEKPEIPPPLCSAAAAA